MEWNKGNFIITTDRIDDSVENTFKLLKTTYWSHKRPIEVVQKVIDTSLCFYLFDGKNQIGFARLITDYSTLSWIADVVLDKKYQNLGLGSWYMKCILEHPDVAHTQFALQTGSAHEFYRRLGFTNNNSLMSTPVDYLD